MKTIVFFLEELSAKEMLIGFLPKILPPEIEPRFITFQGKQDLEKNLVRRLRGWNLPDSLFVVMRDKDSEDCVGVKNKLLTLCRDANRDNVLVRIACHELESFYLGDLDAVEKGLGLNGVASHQETKKFRIPDELVKPSQELNRLTKNRYQKVSGSRAIAPHLDINNKRSKSFNNLVTGIRRLVDQNQPDV